MATPLNLFPARIQIGYANAPGGRIGVQASPEFIRALGDLFNRVGGATGIIVSSISVATANGFAGTTTATTTPVITLTTSITGLLKGDGTAMSAAVSGTDYSAGTASLATGIVKSTTGTGALTIATDADFPSLWGRRFMLMGG